jgi:hypothetical protein
LKYAPTPISTPSTCSKAHGELLELKFTAIPFETTGTAFQSHQRAFRNCDRDLGIFGNKRFDCLAIPSHGMLDIKIACNAK